MYASAFACKDYTRASNFDCSTCRDILKWLMAGRALLVFSNVGSGGSQPKSRLVDVYFVKLWTCVFYAYVKGCTRGPIPFGVPLRNVGEG